MSTDRTIDYIELPAVDIERAKAFYGDVFGWEFVDYGPDYCSFHDGRLDGGFRRIDARSRTADGATLVVLFADDLEATRERVVAHGGEIMEDIYSFPGGRRFHFADPNGNELAVWSTEDG